MKKVVILIGAPGSGKGTQSKILKDHYGIAHISTGDMLRQEIAEGTPLGLKVKGLLAEGKFVDDNVITELLDSRLNNSDCENGFILDGYPRTLNQAEMLGELFEKHNVEDYVLVEIVVEDEVIVKRTLGRYTCKDCGSIYNKYYKPTAKEGICDNCGSSNFVLRNDDNEETIRNRIKIYHEQSKSIIKYYEDKGKVSRIDGLLSFDATKEEILKIVG